MHTAIVPLSICPKCGAQLDCASCASHEHGSPDPGDLSICINCATPLQFDENLMLKELPEAEIAQLPPDTQFDLRKALRVVGELIACKR